MLNTLKCLFATVSTFNPDSWLFFSCLCYFFSCWMGYFLAVVAITYVQPLSVSFALPDSFTRVSSPPF